MIKAAIKERNRVALAYLELARNKTFQKLPEGEKISLIHEVQSIGDETAGKIADEYGTRDPRKIAAMMGVRVLGENCGVKGSEYRRGKSEIVVYRDYHKKALNKVCLAGLSENLLKLLVAHELFHHLEIVRLGEVYKQYPFKRWKIGAYTKQGHIKEISDVAALSFAQALLGLEISSDVFDYLTYILCTNRSRV